MRRAVVVLALALAGAPPAMAQTMAPDVLAAYGVGVASELLSQAYPCFPRGDGGREIDAMMRAARLRIDARPDHAAAFGRAASLTAQQQRYIARSDAVACGQIQAALTYYLKTTD